MVLHVTLVHTTVQSHYSSAGYGKMVGAACSFVRVSHTVALVFYQIVCVDGTTASRTPYPCCCCCRTAAAAAAAATRSEFAKAVGITFKTPTKVFG
jgi:hypothetical protein